MIRCIKQGNTCPGPNGAHEVSDDGERSYAHAAKGSSSGDVAIQLLLQRLNGVTVTLPCDSARC
jgi:hypothetical protein